jgi:hypothetical protein
LASGDTYGTHTNLAHHGDLGLDLVREVLPHPLPQQPAPVGIQLGVAQPQGQPPLPAVVPGPTPKPDPGSYDQHDTDSKLLFVDSDTKI